MNERVHTNVLLSISAHSNSDASPWSTRTEMRQQKQLSLSRYRRFKLGAQKKEKKPKLQKLVRVYIHAASRDGLLGTIHILTTTRAHAGGLHLTILTAIPMLSFFAGEEEPSQVTETEEGSTGSFPWQWHVVLRVTHAFMPASPKQQVSMYATVLTMWHRACAYRHTHLLMPTPPHLPQARLDELHKRPKTAPAGTPPRWPGLNRTYNHSTGWQPDFVRDIDDDKTTELLNDVRTSHLPDRHAMLTKHIDTHKRRLPIC